MFELSIQTHFSAAHTLRGYPGDCARLHGHNWKILVTVVTGQLDQLGMGIDFKILKTYVEDIIDPLDHQDLNTVEPFDRVNPTAEHLAKHIYDQLKTRLQSQNVHIRSVQIWESEKYSALYRESSE